jgi:toxin ParE1/3/4
MQVRWLRTALRDLASQIDFIATDNPEAAARVSVRIRASVARLAEFPDMGRMGRVPSTRELVVAGTPWVVVYQVGTAVEILRVLHASQSWPPRRRDEGDPLAGLEAAAGIPCRSLADC